ncbi:hypothetical protein SO802_029568 [Lithocarpus litseifolius]|uniref:RBR-type E3 ubiquitin transferase n=1 Tax=Lithocarpus litseifolius TaxID=425828 RepID=A0AAW2BX06_9ROSI
MHIVEILTWGSQKQNKEKNNLKHKREKWTTGEESIEGRTTRQTRIKDSGCGRSSGRESAKPRRRKSQKKGRVGSFLHKTSDRQHRERRVFVAAAAMDSEDYMYDSDAEETTYDDDDLYYYSDKEEENIAVGDDDDESRRNKKAKQSYIVLKESDIQQRQENDITEVSNVLSISKAAATVLLLNYNWRACDVQDEWFADEERIRKKVGLFEKPVFLLPNKLGKVELTCSICYENVRVSMMGWVSCGHPFCRECWEKYVSVAIEDGVGCLTLRCPEHRCNAVVDRDSIDLFAKKEDKERYLQYLIRSYIESNKRYKWCPGADCEYTVEFCEGGDDECYDVCCHCNNGFCWNCMDDAHRPVDCETVAKWQLKNSSEAENTAWLLVNTKPCPKCGKAIEKNQGCMHMTCRKPCGHEFCWMCLGTWKEHGERTGGFYACNTFQKNEAEGKYNEDEDIRKRAEKHLEKYTHYYERWAGNESSRKQAVKDLKQMQNDYMVRLSDLRGATDAELKFITDAWLQIIECRRVLKWTYAYGYYLPEDGDKKEKSKKGFFEYLQGEAESNLERLHHCIEKDIHNYLNKERPEEEFKNFRAKLSSLTTVTGNYFENLVKALENGLEDTSSQEACSSQEASSKIKSRTSKKGRKDYG